MAKGLGTNAVELWYYGKGNITNAEVATTYNAGTASQSDTTVTGAGGATFTDAMIGHSLDFVDSDGELTTAAGKILSRSSNTFQVTTSQSVASSDYVIKERGTYALSEVVEMSLSDVGVGLGAAFRVNVRPQARTTVIDSELDSIEVLSEGLNYDSTQQVLKSEGGATTAYYSTKIVEPLLANAAVSGEGTSAANTIHGKVELTINSAKCWMQAKTFGNRNAVIAVDVEQTFNDVAHATVTLINRSPDISSFFATDNASGQFSDFFSEGQEIFLRDQTTHVILFRGRIQEVEDSYEMGVGQVIRLSGADQLQEWADIPAEIFGATPLKTHSLGGVDLPSAKIYTTIENKVRPYLDIDGKERRVTFVEGPEYRLAQPTKFPYDGGFIRAIANSGILSVEGQVAPTRGYGHQVGKRYAFENSWFPRDLEHINLNALGATEQEISNVNERSLISPTVFAKGNLKILTALQNLASQDLHGAYRRTSENYIQVEGSESEWAFHAAPNILSPLPEKLTGETTDGQNDLWITDNTRTLTVAAGIGIGKIVISATDAAQGKGFYPTDVGKNVTGLASLDGGTAALHTEQIRSVSSDHTTLYTYDRINGAHDGDTISWTTGSPAPIIVDSIRSIPQFNYFEVGSRPAFSFGTDSLAGIGESEQDVKKYSITMLSPRKDFAQEQGINPLRSTTTQQSGDRLTQPTVAGVGGIAVRTRIDPSNAYSLTVPTKWEVKMVADSTNSNNITSIEYRRIFLGAKFKTDGSDFVTWYNASDDPTILIDETFFTLEFNVQINFDAAGTADDIYRFNVFPKFDNRKALKLMGLRSEFSKYGYEKYSNALVYYDAEAVTDSGFGTSARIEAQLIYGWGVQNRSWIFNGSVNTEINDKNPDLASAETMYQLRVHHGDTLTPQSTYPVAGSTVHTATTGECINFSDDTTPITSVDNFSGGDAFEKPHWLGEILEMNNASWDDTRKSRIASNQAEYVMRDFLWRDTQLTTGKFAFRSTDVGGASRGGRASEYLDLYRGRYSRVPLNRDENGTTIPAQYQVEWRRWESGEKIAAVQYVSVSAPYQASPAVDIEDGGVHPTSGGSVNQFPFAAGDDETKMVQLLISFDEHTTGQAESVGSIGGQDEDSGNWPTTNTYDETGEPQKASGWRDFPYVRLVGRTTGTKIDFNADVGNRKSTNTWQGRPIDTWQALRPLRKSYRKDHSRDAIRLDLVQSLHKRVADMRIGKFRTPKMPYYWLEAQVDGFKESGSNNYGDDDIDPTGESPASNNPNLTKTIRFKLQHLGATTGTKYFNPLQYGLMIGNVVRFYNHDVGGGSATDQDFEDSKEFCYGVITDIQPVTTSPQYFVGSAYQSGRDVTGSGTTWTADMIGGTFRWVGGGTPTSGKITHHTGTTAIKVENSQTVGASNDPRSYVINRQNEDTFDMCGWIEVELTHVARKSMTTTGGVRFQRVVAASTNTTNGYTEDQLNPGVATSATAYDGPTRVRVYNMLYPGYSVYVEDASKGISAKHVIEGLRFSFRQGVLETEYYTSGKKTDHTLSKWGTTPVRVTRGVLQSISVMTTDIKRTAAQTVGPVGANEGVDKLGSQGSFYFGEPGTLMTDIFQGFSTDTEFYV